MKIPAKQSGYTSTAMIAMLAIGGILTAGAARHTLNTVSESQGLAYGTALASVNKSVGTYTVLNYAALINGTAVAGVANPLQPTVQELSALGLLNAEVNPVPPMGGAYAIQISREPAGCVAPNCNLTSRTWYTQPFTNPATGNVDIEKLAAAAQAINGDGGWSAADSPDTVRGTGGWSRPNPVANTAGILVAINGYGSSVFSNYVDRTGVQGMLADLKLGGNNINGINAVNAQNVVLPAAGAVKIGTTRFFGSATDAAIYTPGALHVQHDDYSPADIAVVRNITSSGGIWTQKLESTGDVIAQVNSWTGGVSHARDVIATTGWFRTRENTGWYSEKWNGGLYMSDANWVRSYADKSMYTGGQMQAGSLQSNSTLSVAGHATVGSQTVNGSQTVGGNHTVYGSAAVTNALTPGMIASEGGYCGGNAGAIARDGNNNLFVCN